jgi:glutathione S-transferase
MPDLEILGVPESNFVWAVRIACAERGAAHALRPLPPHHPEVTAINPFGAVPVLRSGPVALSESRAIVAWVDAAFPGERLTPSDPLAAATAEMWVSRVLTVVEPVAIRRYLFGYLFPETPDGAPDRPAIDAALPRLRLCLDAMAAGVAPGFVGSDRFGLADCWFAPIVHYLSALPESGAMIAANPALSAYAARVRDRPSVRETAPPPPGREGSAEHSS